MVWITIDVRGWRDAVRSAKLLRAEEAQAYLLVGHVGSGARHDVRSLLRDGDATMPMSFRQRPRDGIAIVQIDSPVEVYRRSSLDLTHWLIVGVPLKPCNDGSAH